MSIDVQRLGVRRGGRSILEQVQLHIPANSLCALVGPNGAGKTTLLRAMIGAIQPDFGAVRICGADPAQDPSVRRRIGWLPDNPALEDGLRVSEHLLLHARLHGLSAPHSARVQEALQLVELTDQARRLCGLLSRGQRTRLALATCLLHRPQVLVLDEPSSGLDPAQAASLRALLQRLKTYTAIVLSSHVLPEVSAVCDQIAVLHRGRIRFHGAVQELAAHSGGNLEHAYLALTGASP